MGKKVFIVDIARCNGCYCCQIACKDEHVGNDWSPYAKPQPDTGQFWLQAERVRARHRAQGEAPLRGGALPALRPRPPASRPARSRAPSTSAKTAWSSSTPRSAPAAESACSPARTTPSSSTTTSTSRRSAPVAPTCSTRAGPCPAAWTSAPPGAIKFGDESEFAAEIAKATLLGPGGRDQAARLLPEHAQAIHRRPGLRPGREGDRRGAHAALWSTPTGEKRS